MKVLKSAAPVHSDVVKSAPVQLDIEILKQVAGGVVTPPDPISRAGAQIPSDPTW